MDLFWGPSVVIVINIYIYIPKIHDVGNSLGQDAIYPLFPHGIFPTYARCSTSPGPALGANKRRHAAQ